MTNKSKGMHDKFSGKKMYRKGIRFQKKWKKHLELNAKELGFADVTKYLSDMIVTEAKEGKRRRKERASKT